MEEEKKSMSDEGGVIETWLRKHKLLYIGATRHPFILSIRDGTVDLSSYQRWLGQDYIFVRAFVPFVASVLVKSWKASDESSYIDAILGGLASLNDEIAWFKKEASKWDLMLSSISPLKPNANYCRFLESLMSPELDYAVAITAFWAIEAVYHQSFAHCREEGSNTPTELKETCDRWGGDDFGMYCRVLQGIANQHLNKAGIDALSRAEAVFITVLEHEIEFWKMSSKGI